MPFLIATAGFIACLFLRDYVAGLGEAEEQRRLAGEGRQQAAFVEARLIAVADALLRMGDRAVWLDQQEQRSWREDALNYKEDLLGNPELDLISDEGQLLETTREAASLPDGSLKSVARYKANYSTGIAFFLIDAEKGSKRSLHAIQAVARRSAAGADRKYFIVADFPAARVEAALTAGLSSHLFNRKIYFDGDPLRLSSEKTFSQGFQTEFDAGQTRVVSDISPTPAFIDAMSSVREEIVFLIGLLLTALLTGLTYRTHQLGEALGRSETLKQKADIFLQAIEHAQDCITVMDASGRIIFVNKAYEAHRMCRREDVLGKNFQSLATSVGKESYYSAINELLQRGESWAGRLDTELPDGRVVIEESTVSPVQNDAGEMTGMVAVIRDITAQMELQSQLSQAQKLESVGQLAAGIAHEINTPVQFIGDNLRYLGEAFDELGNLIRELKGGVRQGQPLSAEGLQSLLDEADVDFLLEEAPGAIKQSAEGTERVAKIVRAMKDFSHPSVEVLPADLNKGIESTVMVARNEWKYVAELHLDLDGQLPMVPCVLSEINQCVFNIVVNAGHALGGHSEANGGGLGEIHITTSKEGGYAVMRIRDNGPGMPETVRNRIFEPFFTTKEVGKGTGQGLAIAYNSIVETHGGRLEVESEPDKGTCFTIMLPLEEASGCAENTAASIGEVA